MENSGNQIRGNARRALVTAGVFAFAYTVWDVVSHYYFPSFLNAGRLPMLYHLALFLLAGGLFAFYLLQSRKDGSGPDWLRSETAALVRRPEFLIAAIWFVWSCIAGIIAIREGFVTVTHISSYIFDQFVNFLLLFPVGYLLARQRDTRCMTAAAAVCFLCFLPYAVCGAAVAFTHTGRIFLGREVVFDTFGRLRLGSNTNTGGIYGAMAFIGGLYLLRETSRRWLQGLIVLSEGLIFYILLLTGSRGSLGAATVALLFFGAVFLARRFGAKVLRAHRTLLIGIVAVLALAGIGLVSVALRRMTGRDLMTTDLGVRGTVWRAVLQAMVHNPHYLLHGVSSAVVPLETGKLLNEISFSTHNTLLELWFGQGTPALCLFLGFLVLTAYHSLRVSFRHSGGNWAAALFILALFINSMVEVMLVNTMTTSASLFCLAAGTVCGLSSQLKKREARP